MSNANEHRIKAIVILLTLIWHFIILCILFILTRKEPSEPLRITAEPKFIEYLLNSLTQLQHASTPQPGPATPVLPQSIQQRAQQQVQQALEEDGYEEYLLKNAISYGSYTQGSIVTVGQEYGNEPETQPEQQGQSMPDKLQEEPEEEPASPTEQETDGPAAPETIGTAQEQQTTNFASGISELIAHAEELANDSGSSWVTPAQHSTQVHAGAHTTSSSGHSSSQGHGLAEAPCRQTGNTNKKLTLADITRSYVKHVQHEKESTGHCTYSQAGSPAGPVHHGVYAPPTDGVALAEQIYAGKLYNLLEQSAQAYSSQIYSRRDIEMETMIEVTIEKSGKILDVTLKPSLPEKDMEQALCLIVRRVGLFPPIPKQFHKQRIILSIPIRIRSKQGFASYRLLYGISTT